MDSEQFKRHIIPLQSGMQLLAERILGSAEEAEDTVQDVFVTLWERRKELDSIDNLTGYCLQAIRTRCVDKIRRRDRERSHMEVVRMMSDEAVMMEIDETERRSQMLHQLLETLPEKQRRLVEMKYLEDCDTNQMVRATGMSSNNIYVTLSRTMQTLKEKLKKTAI